MKGTRSTLMAVGERRLYMMVHVWALNHDGKVRMDVPAFEVHACTFCRLYVEISGQWLIVISNKGLSSTQ